MLSCAMVVLSISRTSRSGTFERVCVCKKERILRKISCARALLEACNKKIIAEEATQSPPAFTVVPVLKASMSIWPVRGSVADFWVDTRMSQIALSTSNSSTCAKALRILLLMRRVRKKMKTSNLFRTSHFGVGFSKADQRLKLTRCSGDDFATDASASHIHVS
jgi:hypothetical protein